MFCPMLMAAGRLKSYNPNLVLDRSIIGRSCRKIGSGLIPDTIELKTFGRTGYTLKMTLISADIINEI